MDAVYAQQLYEMVQNTRAQLAGKWPTPTEGDSLEYAVTEVAEALDADLRNRRPNDKRNNSRNVSVEHELAQAAMMLLTAIGSSVYYLKSVKIVEETTLALIAYKTAQAWKHYESMGDSYNATMWPMWLDAAIEAVAHIDVYCVGVDGYLEEVLKHAEEKWG